jgi:hypothetical protein
MLTAVPASSSGTHSVNNAPRYGGYVPPGAEFAHECDGCYGLHNATDECEAGRYECDDPIYPQRRLKRSYRKPKETW